jgi:hypothetical protein
VLAEALGEGEAATAAAYDEGVEIFWGGHEGGWIKRGGGGVKIRN